MSNIIVTSLSSPASNITINDSDSTSTSVSSTGGETTVVTINQGIPGPPGSGIVDIIGGTGINVSYASGTYTISSSSITPSLTGLELASINSGRITLQSGDPTYLDNISGSTIYYSPYLGNNISLYNIGTNAWELYTFSEISLALSSLTTDTNYDIFLYDDGGANLVLERVGWSNNTTRSVALVNQDGVLVKSGSLNKRYVGTIRSTNTNTTEDSTSRRFVFNANNQIPKLLFSSDNITHTYTSSTIRAYRNITTLGLTRAEFIVGFLNHPIDLICNSVFITETASSSVGVSVDSTIIFNTLASNTTAVSSGPALISYGSSSDYITSINTGYHYLQLLQLGSSVTTFYNALFKTIISC